ncbi:MAG: hydroxymethylpyrimidine/phosphomethylpyrimidine kinase [Wenzhouxiangellaceae bacterium]|nr:hydroxymethylpyrimidine/phosphomethylpyrimidine kinase [Wenzhouxiangellaceae bacterium]
MSATRPCILIFAGVDPSGGAGVSADIEAVGAVGGHPLPVVTVLTVQDNDRVHAIHPVLAPVVTHQAQALIEKIRIDAVKIGIVGSRANAEAIAAIIGMLQDSRPDIPVVLDPVLASGRGDALSPDDAADAVAPLLPLASLVTPNLMEASRLCGGETDLEQQAARLLGLGSRNVLIKGGHGPAGEDIVNTWFSAAGSCSWRWPCLTGEFHGSGCTLASAIATRLALGEMLEDALFEGQVYTHRALRAAYPIAPGQKIPQRRIVFAS